MTHLAKANRAITNAKNAERKIGIKLRLTSIPVVSPQDMERLRRIAKDKTNRIFPELPEWRKAK